MLAKRNGHIVYRREHMLKRNGFSTLLIALLLGHSIASANASAQLSLTGKGELGYIYKNSSATDTPWWNEGTELLAYANSGFYLGPQLAAITLDTETPWSAILHAQWHTIPTTDLGLTEAWLNYRPLPISGYRFRARLGYFYPALSLENVDTAWSSPYSSNFSVINSWFAEELRARGAEISVTRSGRFFNSPADWQIVGGLFQGNDPLGAIISWRGFASHGYQTNLGEQVRFAPYPSLNTSFSEIQPPWVQPTRELDHRTGFYVGLHYLLKNHTEIRLYHYDNKGDPKVFKHGQYAWDTQFQNLSVQHQVNANWRIIGQLLKGTTEMGPGGVKVKFYSWFGLLHFDAGHYQVNLRYDYWRQQDQDQKPNDNNNGNGTGFNINIQYPLNDRVRLALEWSQFKSYQASRLQFTPLAADQVNKQLQLMLYWHLD